MIATAISSSINVKLASERFPIRFPRDSLQDYSHLEFRKTPPKSIVSSQR
jgi:hypothetical protein